MSGGDLVLNALKIALGARSHGTDVAGYTGGG